MDILRDPIWQFMGALLALVAIVVAIYIYFLQKYKKSLSYTILTDNELLTTSEELHGKIKIFFGKTRIQNINFLAIQIKNEGNVPILPTDFYEKLSLSFGSKTKILSAELTERYPDTLKPILRVETTTLLIDPILINHEDYFTIKVLLSQYDNQIKVGGRIAGVKSIRKAINLENSPLYWRYKFGIRFLFPPLLVGFIIGLLVTPGLLSTLGQSVIAKVAILLLLLYTINELYYYFRNKATK